jgi:hypothetical protein
LEDVVPWLLVVVAEMSDQEDLRTTADDFDDDVTLRGGIEDKYDFRNDEQFSGGTSGARTGNRFEAA